MKRTSILLAMAFAWVGAIALGSLPVGAHPGIDTQMADVDARIEREPENAELYLRRGELHRVHRKWSDAEADYARARALSPKLAVIDLYVGRLELEAGRPKKALKPLNRFIASHPDHARALVTRARARVATKRPLEAAADYTRAIAASTERNRPKPEYFLERARATVAAGPQRIGQAIRGLDEGLTTLGQPITLQLYAIELELERGHHDAALERIDRIAAGATRRETWLMRRAEILEQVGRRDDAGDAYRSAIEALETLPKSRRSTRATERVRTAAEQGLRRLADSDPLTAEREP